MNNIEIIPLSVPNLSGNEWKYVKECLDTGWISSVGEYVTAFEKAVADFVGAAHGVAIVNGTCALHLCLKLLGVRPGDYVVIPNITFVATANAVKYLGADPILIDTDPNTWQMDLDLLEKCFRNDCERVDGGLQVRVDKRPVRLVMPVHVQGNMCDMRRLQDLCLDFGIELFEDSTEALGTTFDGRSAGRFGRMGVYSFNGNKIISTGGGGVAVTDDKEVAARLKHLSTQAKASPTEYYHDEVGYNYRLVNILAAVGLAQMEQLPKFIQRKREITDFYRRSLSGVGDISFQKIIPEVKDNGWLFTIRSEQQKELLRHLNQNGIQSRPFWMPMKMLPMYANAIYVTDKDCSSDVYGTCLSIPSSTSITDTQLKKVADEIQAFFNK
jgi:perosamine synthetase